MYEFNSESTCTVSNELVLARRRGFILSSNNVKFDHHWYCN